MKLTSFFNYLSRIWRKNIIVDFEDRGNDFYFSCHLLFATIFFSNFFLFNQIFIASSNALSIPLVLELLAKRSILSGQLNLWYPYGLLGHPIYLSSIVPIFSPQVWLQLFLPERYFFFGATFMQFLCFWLIGVFSYLFFYEELRSKKWAFFSSIIFLFSGYLLDVTISYSPIFRQLFTSLSLYLIWTMHKRKEYLNYVYLTIALILIMGGHHVAHASFSLVMIVVFFLYRYFSKTSEASRFRRLFIFFSALITSGLIIMIRVLPVLFDIQNTVRSIMMNALRYILNAPFFTVVRLFDSEFFGIDRANHVLIFSSLYKAYTGYNLQVLFAQFFGILSALLVLWIIITPQEGRKSFLKYYVVIVILGLLQVEPFISFFKIVFPTWHDNSVQVFLPLAFAILAGYAAKGIEENANNFAWFDRSLKHFIFWVVLIISFILLLWQILALYKISLNLIRLYLIILFFLGIAVFFVYTKWPSTIKKLSFLAFRVIPILGLIAILIMFFLVDNKKPIFLYHFRILLFSLFMLILSGVALQTMIFDKARTKGVFFNFFIPIGIIFLGIVFYPGTRNIIKDPSLQLNEVLQLSVLGFVRFVVVAIIFISIIILLMKKRFKPAWIFPFFLALLLFDLIPTNKVHKYVYYANPFHQTKTPYPQISDFRRDYGVYRRVLDFENLELKNYRLGGSDTMLEREIGQKIGLTSLNAYVNANALYDIRTYGGQIDGIYRRTAEFIQELAPSIKMQSVEILQAPDAEDAFLDLACVGYIYDEGRKAIKVRPNALSRFMLFKSYEVIRGQEVLKRLKDPAFDYHKTVILENDPGIPAISIDNNAKKLEYFEPSTDLIEFNLDSSSPGILLFNDNYHKGWKAYVNKKEQPVFHANYNFMATTVPVGKTKIVFKFRPKEFYYSLYIMALGFLVFLLTAVILYLRRERSEDYPERRGIISRVKSYKMTFLFLLFFISVVIINILFR